MDFVRYWRHYPRYVGVWATFNSRVRHRFQHEIQDLCAQLRWLNAAVRRTSVSAARHRYRIRLRQLRLSLISIYRVAAEEGRREAYRAYVVDAPYFRSAIAPYF